ncbi:hypothetical protein [Actinopolymorpha alba]|uniref:hypothetical protein n=1 Tax=Actinopolymorpha alba TaxID=533267 RepID=UPI000379BB17|nr:hypothetical protein [Actinopolymorpha alba]
MTAGDRALQPLAVEPDGSRLLLFTRGPKGTLVEQARHIPLPLALVVLSRPLPNTAIRPKHVGLSGEALPVGAVYAASESVGSESPGDLDPPGGSIGTAGDRAVTFEPSDEISALHWSRPGEHLDCPASTR